MPNAAPAHDGLGILDVGAVILYLAATLGIAILASRKRGTTEEFFLGGRRMPWFAVGLSIMSTLMSTISYLATPGEMIKNGVAMFVGYLAIPFSMVVVLWGWVPFFMRLRMTSAYEYLEQRFSYPVRLLAAALFILLRLGWLAVVIYTSSSALDKMVDLEAFTLPWNGADGNRVVMEPIYFWIALSGLFTTVYTALGGIRAVIWTDVMQSIVMFAGAIITLLYVMLATHTGPVDWWQTASEMHIEHTRPIWFSFDVTIRVTVFSAILNNFFWTICTHGSDQMIVQRYFSTSSLTAARKSYVISAIADVSVGVLLALCGLALLAFYVGHPGNLPPGITFKNDADKVFPHFISHQLQWGLGGVILSALFAAAMSSMSSGINSVTAVTTTDILARLLPRGERLLQGMKFARLLSAGVGLLSTVLAFVVAYMATHSQNNIMELMPKGFNMFLGPLAGLFFAGMFLPRCTSKSAMVAVLCGLMFTFVWSYWKEILWILGNFGFHQTEAWMGKLLGQDAEGQYNVPSFTLAIALPCLLTVGVAAALSWITGGRGTNGRAELTWSAVMRRKIEVETKEEGSDKS